MPHPSNIQYHRGDLPVGLHFDTAIAVDCEAMGLNPKRDPLCVVQLSSGDGTAHVVQMNRSRFDCPNLKQTLSDPALLKIFHFARFDLAIIRHYLQVECAPVYCTKTASRLVRTYTDRHGLKDLCKELINVDLSKQQQSSDWGAESLSDAQLSYAASDVLYLHALKAKLDQMLAREGRRDLAEKIFAFLPVRAELDLAGWEYEDIFAHS